MNNPESYWESLVVRNDKGKLLRKLDLREALAKYPYKNASTLERDIRRAVAKFKGTGGPPSIPVEKVERKSDKVEFITGALPIKKSGLTKFVVLFDLHYPYQVHQSVVMDFLGDFQPDILVYGGDEINADPFDHWALKNPRKTRNLPTPQPYYEAANRELFIPIRKTVPNALIVAMYGNHEDWAREAVDDEPRGEGFWEPEFNLEGIDMWVPPREMINLGKLYIIHGDQIEGRGGVSPARALVLRGYNRSMIVGHLHTYDVATQMSPIDANDRHVLEYSPCLTSFNPPFMQNHPHRWVQGFVYGYVEANGNFYRQTVVITDGRFMSEGKIYG